MAKVFQDIFFETQHQEIYEKIFESVDIIDCHAHIGVDVDGHRISAEQLVKAMDKSHINKAIVFSLNEPLNNRHFIEPNNKILKAYRDYPNRFVPFFRLNPVQSNWHYEFDRRIDQGFRGVKLHPRSQNFHIMGKEIMKIYEKAEENGLIVILHTGFGLGEIAEDLKNILTQFKKLKLVLGHSAFVDLENTMKKVGNFGNVMFDTSTLKIFDLLELLKKVEHSKIAFGSDIPYYDIDISLQMVVDSSIIAKKTPAQIRSILGANISNWLK